MSKKNKIFCFLSLFLFITIGSFFAINAKAHAPMHLNLDYDMDNDIFSVSFIHGVTDPDYHYVANVLVYINHSHTPTINETYTSQPSTNIWTYEYNFVANYNEN